MKYVVVTCGTDINRIEKRGVYDTYEEAHDRLVECQDEVVSDFIGEFNIHFDESADEPKNNEPNDCFDIWPEDSGYEYYGQILMIE